MQDETIIAELHASEPRRLTALAVLVALGLLLIALGFASQASFDGRLMLIAFGAVALWVAMRLRVVTRGALFLTETALVDHDGKLIAALDDIDSVARGAFAFKPSGGFTLVMKTRQPRAYVPGLWWRGGYRVGVGGVTGQGAARFMAEMIALKLAARA